MGNQNYSGLLLKDITVGDLTLTGKQRMQESSYYKIVLFVVVFYRTHKLYFRQMLKAFRQMLNLKHFQI